MQNPLGTHIQIWSGGWSPDEVKRAAEISAAIGYQFVELPVRAPETVDADALSKILEANGLFCTTAFVHTPETDIASEDPATVEKGVALMFEALAKARDMGSKRLVGGQHSSLAKHNQARSQKGRDNAVGALRRIAEKAKGMDMILCLEALNRYENNLANTGTQLLDLIADIGADNVYAHLDTFHMNIEEADPAETLRRVGDRLGYLHLAENYRGYLGTGSIDFAAIFRALNDIGYDGPMALEVFSSAVVNPQHSARLAVWRELWNDSEDMARHAHAFITAQMETINRRLA
ncbi:MAG: sugar phosphate isomerase/epimerase [Rhodospirillales bacterium]|nr:sugar phosphate isomerase/epimerase [Rhodospirillales bacterium]